MARSIKLLPLLFLLSTVAIGCRTIWVHPEATEAKWDKDFYRCRFGMTPEQLEARNENPDAESLRLNPSWEACLSESGWDTRPGSNLGPQWDD